MVVEDDKEMNQLECELLQIHGMRAVPAYSGTEAVDIVARCDADAVLLDMMLPEMDGFECCRCLRDLNSRNLPIVIITALDSDDPVAFEIVLQDGTTLYFAGVVMSYTTNVGSVDQITSASVMIEITTDIVEVAAT